MKKSVNGLLIFILIFLPTAFGYLRLPTQMGLSILGVSLALAFSNLDKFSRFKGAGFEAVLKEAQEVVDKAGVVMEDLKNLGLALTEPIIDTMAVSGRMLQFIHVKHKLANTEEIERNLEKLGASPAEIDDVCGILYERVEADHYRQIAYALKEANPKSGGVFSEIGMWEYSDWDKARVESMIADNGLVTNEAVLEYMSDLDYWLENRALRREDEWQS